MRNLLIYAAVLLTTTQVSADIDLMPAYRIKIPGTQEWKLIKKYNKDPVFVEGLEFINDNTLIESAGGY
jgi:hypothetical protein